MAKVMATNKNKLINNLYISSHELFCEPDDYFVSSC